MKTIKRISLLLTVLLLAVMCFAVTAGAQDENREGDFEYRVSNGEATLIRCYNITDETMTLPEELGGYPLVRVSREAFSLSNIRKLIISDCVKELETDAFDASNVRELYIGSGVEVIGDGVFGLGNTFWSEKVHMEKVTVSPDNKYFSSDEEGILYNKDKTELVDYPNSNPAKSYTIPETVKRIRPLAFYASHYLEEFTFGEHFTSVPDSLLMNCSSLKTVNFTDNITSIGNNSFTNCTSIANFNLPSKLKTIGDGAFENCSSLESLIIPRTVTEIGKYAFANSEILKVIEIPEGVTEICENTFDCCSGLQAVILPLSVKTIGDCAFRGCKSLKALYYTGTAEDLKKIKVGSNNDIIYSVPVYLVVLVKAPAKVISSQNTNSIKLSWSAVKGVTGYRVFYKTASGWKTCATTSGTSHTFKNLPAGKKYTFGIRSYYINPDKTVTWSDNYIIHEATTQAVAPAKITVAQNTTALRLTWTACPGATGYRIYYKSGNSWKIALNTTSATTHTFTGLKAGSKFTVAVRPYIKLSDRVVWSDYTTYDAATLPVAPKVSAVSTLGGSVTVSWSAVNGAEGYQLFFKVNNGSYKLYKTYPSAQKLTFNGLVKGAKYTFAVRAYKKTTGGYIFGAYKPVSATIAYKITRYNNVFKSGTFMMVVDDPDLGEVTQAMKNGNMYIRSSMDGMDMTLVYKKSNEKWYMIMHDLKKYTVMPEDMLSDMDMDELNEEIQKDEKIAYKTSYVTVKGKKLECESGKNSEGDTYKYYFDGDTLVISQTVSADGETTTTYFKSITNKVSDSLFKIPSGYAYMEMEWLFSLASEAL